MCAFAYGKLPLFLYIYIFLYFWKVFPWSEWVWHVCAIPLSFDNFFEPFHKSTCHGLKMGVLHCRFARYTDKPVQSFRGAKTRTKKRTEVRNPGERDRVNQNKETWACFLSTSWVRELKTSAGGGMLTRNDQGMLKFVSQVWKKRAIDARVSVNLKTCYSGCMSTVARPSQGHSQKKNSCEQNWNVHNHWHCRRMPKDDNRSESVDRKNGGYTCSKSSLSDLHLR